MPSFMDQALDSYRAPSADEMEIVLPGRREPKKEQVPAETADQRDLGQHGGAADSNPGSDGHEDAASSAPEPAPQRDDPDEGEHTDSTEEAVAARIRPAPEAAQTSQEAPVAAATEDQVENVFAAVGPVVQLPSDPVEFKKALSKMEGTRPRPFNRTGFSAGENIDTVTVSRFPQPIVDRLRMMLARTLGGEFAEAISTVSLMTAYMTATIGVDLEVDDNTSAATDAFRSSDERLSAVEDRVSDLNDNINQLAGATSHMINRLRTNGEIADGLEFAMAYLIADRVEHLTTNDIDAANIDVAQKKVLVARESIRTKAKAQRTIEQQRDGRRMA